MSIRTVPPPAHDAEDIDISPATSQSSCSIITTDSFLLSIQTEFSSVSGSLYSAAGTEGSFDDSSLDSIGQMLIRLNDNDASLTELIVDCRLMDEQSVAYFDLFLPKNKFLKKLRLRCGRSPFYQDILRRLLLSLPKNSSIKTLEIENAHVDSDVASWLVPSFVRSRTLIHIGMINCMGSGLERLIISMQHNQHVQKLSFRSCRWRVHIADIVASSLPFMNLQSLSLVDIKIAKDGWPYLIWKIMECKELEVLDLSRNKIDASSIYLLAKSLASEKLISKLILSSCRLDDKCVKELAKGLKHHSKLTSLDISKNDKISEKGVMYLTDLLNFNNSITHLKVDRCCLNMESIYEIENRLHYNNSFVKSFVSYPIFDFVDSTCAPKYHYQGNVTKSANKNQTTDDRDADETKAIQEDERSPPADENCSIKTEHYSVKKRSSPTAEKTDTGTLKSSMKGMSSPTAEKTSAGALKSSMKGRSSPTSEKTESSTLKSSMKGRSSQASEKTDTGALKSLIKGRSSPTAEKTDPDKFGTVKVRFSSGMGIETFF